MTMSDRAGATSGAATSSPPGIPDFTSVFLGFVLFNFCFSVKVCEPLLVSTIYGTYILIYCKHVLVLNIAE